MIVWTLARVNCKSEKDHCGWGSRPHRPFDSLCLTVKRGMQFLQVIADVNHSHIWEREEPLLFFWASEARGQLPLNHEGRLWLIAAVQLPPLFRALSRLLYPSSSFLLSSLITVSLYPVGIKPWVFLEITLLPDCMCVCMLKRLAVLNSVQLESLARWQLICSILVRVNLTSVLLLNYHNKIINDPTKIQCV